MRKSIAVIAAFACWMLAGLAGVGQTSTSADVSFLTTNRFSDGSTLAVQDVSFGIVHRVRWSFGSPPSFFKSASPTILFTTCRQAMAGHYATEKGFLFAEAEALDSSGKWQPLRCRLAPKPVKEGLPDNVRTDFSGPIPTVLFETWEFPHCPEASPWLCVRVRITSWITNVSTVEFKLPNDSAWRERSVGEQTNGFNSQEWLNHELVRSVACRDADYLKELISQGTDASSTDSEGNSALWIACQNAQENVVRCLLERGAKVNVHGVSRSMDTTPLMAAAFPRVNPTIIRLLVERGADVNARGGFGLTPLICAAQAGGVESVKYLLSKGADPNLKTERGDTALECLEKYGGTNSVEIIRILKEDQTGR